MSLNSLSSSYFTSAEITGLYYYVWLLPCWGLKVQCLLDKVPYQLSYMPGPFFIHQCHGRGKWKQTIVNTQEAEPGEWL